MIFLTTADVLDLHDTAIAESGGATGLRDLRLLDSAVAQPQMTAFKEYVHQDIFQMAAAYFFHIVKNHAFVDGNKRTGVLAALTFLKANGIKTKADFDSLYDLAIAVAVSRRNKDDIATFLRRHRRKNQSVHKTKTTN